MNIGQLRDRVTIQQRSATTDSHGGRAVAWTALATVWANVTALSAIERLQASAMNATAMFIVTMRYRADLSPTMRLQWTPFDASSAKTLQITGLRPADGERDWLLLDCLEVLS